MAHLLRDRALLLKSFYQTGYNATKGLCLNRWQKSLRKGPLTLCTLRRIVKCFEEAVPLQFKQALVVKKRKPQLMDDIAISVVEQANSNTTGVCSARAKSRQLDLSKTTVWTCMRSTLNAYPHKIYRLQELKPGDNDFWKDFALTFLAGMEEEQKRPVEHSMDQRGSLLRVWNSQHT